MKAAIDIQAHLWQSRFQQKQVPFYDDFYKAKTAFMQLIDPVPEASEVGMDSSVKIIQAISK